jgi:hypothetical protein
MRAGAADRLETLGDVEHGRAGAPQLLVRLVDDDHALHQNAHRGGEIAQLLGWIEPVRCRVHVRCG